MSKKTVKAFENLAGAITTFALETYDGFQDASHDEKVFISGAIAACSDILSAMGVSAENNKPAKLCEEIEKML